MTNYDTSATLLGASRTQVESALIRLGLEAYISSDADLTVVCPRETAEDMVSVTQRLSEACGCFALELHIVDDDTVRYRLFQRGVLQDHYDSCPEVVPVDPAEVSPFVKFLASTRFPVPKALRRWAEARLAPKRKPPEGGNATLLCEVFGKSAAVAEVERVLRHQLSVADLAALARAADGVIWDGMDELRRYARLAQVLSLPEQSIGVNFDRIHCQSVHNFEAWTLAGGLALPETMELSSEDFNETEAPPPADAQNTPAPPGASGSSPKSKGKGKKRR